MDKEVDSLSEEEQKYFFDNITYDIIEEFIDERITAALIEGITEENFAKDTIHINKLLKDLCS